MAKEQAKHRKRLARLERVREMLKKKGNTKALDQLDKSLLKENTRHQRVTGRLAKSDKDANRKFVRALKKADKQKAKAAREKVEKTKAKLRRKAKAAEEEVKKEVELED